MLLPCQIIRTGRRLIYRLLSCSGGFRDKISTRGTLSERPNMGTDSSPTKNAHHSVEASSNRDNRPGDLGSSKAPLQRARTVVF
jgi:hypothetical protein